MLNRLKPKSELTRNILTLMSGTTIAQAIPLLISPLLTRLYSPEDFGLFAIFVSIVSIMAVIVTGRYDLAIILPKLDSHGFQLLSLSLFIALSVSFVYLLGMSSLNFFYTFDVIYYLIPFVVLFIGFNNAFDRYNNKTKNYKVMSYQRVIKTTIESLVNIFFSLFFHLKTGLIWGFVLGYFVSSLSMVYINFKFFKIKKFYPSAEKMNILARRYINFPKYNMPHGLLNTISANTAIFLIPMFYGNATLGLYAFGLKIIQAPLGLLSSSIFNVLGQKMAEEYAKANEIRGIFLLSLKKLTFVALMMLPLFVFIKEIFSFVFGEEWRDAGLFIQILSPWILLIFISSPFATLPQIFNQQKKALIIEIISFILKSMVLVLGGLFLSIEGTLVGLMLISVLIISYNLIWYFGLVRYPKKDENE